MTQSVYDEVADFMATMNPAKVIAFKPSDANQNRFDFLLDKQMGTNLSNDEKSTVLYTGLLSS